MRGLYNTKSLLAVLFTSLMSLITACRSDIFTPASTKSIQTFSQVQAAICDKQIVLLGEGPNHGEGVTETFKAKLAQSLIKNCGFELILFESSFYEFAKINADLAEARPVKLESVAAAIGGLWRYDKEIQSFLNYMTAAMNTGVLTVGGIDDRVAGRGQDFTNFKMSSRIMKTRGSECQDLLSRKAAYAFSRDNPYDRSKKARLMACLSQNDISGESHFDTELASAMRASLLRMIKRDFGDNHTQIQGREISMYENFCYWYEREPTPPKTIIWTATVHAAKSGKFFNLTHDVRTIGQMINERFPETSYVIGFSALKGKHRLMGGKFEILPDAPKNSLEAMSMLGNNADTVF